jgi:hypothetical protein
MSISVKTTDRRVKNPEAMAAKAKLEDFITPLRARLNPMDISTLPSCEQLDELRSGITRVLKALGRRFPTGRLWTDLCEVDDRYRSLKLREFPRQILQILENGPDPMTIFWKQLVSGDVSEPLLQVLIEANHREIDYKELGVSDWLSISSFIEDESAHKTLVEIKKWNKHQLSDFAVQVESSILAWSSLRHLQYASRHWTEIHRTPYLMAMCYLRELSYPAISDRAEQLGMENLGFEAKNRDDLLRRYKSFPGIKINKKSRDAWLSKIRQHKFRRVKKILNSPTGGRFTERFEDYSKLKLVDKWVNPKFEKP